MRFHFWASIKHILKNRISSIVLEAFYPLYGPKTKSVVHSAKYKVIGLKICMRAHFMVVQAVLERRSSKQILSIWGHPNAKLTLQPLIAASTARVA